LHVSWLVSLFCTGVILGIAIAPFAETAIFAGSQALAVALSLAAVAMMDRRALAVCLIVLSGLILGFSRADTELASFARYEPFYKQRVELGGTVSEDTTIAYGGQQRIRLKEVTINGQQLAGQVWISTSSNEEIKRSDEIQASGFLSEGFGSFQASMHRADIQSITSIEHRDIAREVRDWFAGGVKRVISEPEASLGIGYLTGQRNTLPKMLDDNLRLLGLTHIVVASGFNLTILVRFARRALAGVSKYLATVSSLALMISFIMVTGFSPSMSRAGIVTGLSLLAWYFGRKIHPFVLLPAAACITVLLNPSFIWGDLGWYLSFSAFAGVIILAPLLRHYFFDESGPGLIKQILLETTSAQLATLPIIAYIFGQYTPLALPANLLVLPLVAVAMALTFIAGLAGLTGLGILFLLGWPAQMVLNYMTAVIDKLASLPIADGEISFGFPAVLASYLILSVVCVFLWRKTRHDFKQDNIVE
jgi:competence protein ComEC